MITDRQDSLDLLYAPFRARVEAGLARLRTGGILIYPFETYRAPERQDALYKQGRDPGSSGSIVTNARAYQSWHQYGFAVDLVFGGPGRWTWNGPYQAVGAAMVAEGLDWYGALDQPFKELPHIQLKPIFSLEAAKGLFIAGGIEAVWAAALKTALSG